MEDSRHSDSGSPGRLSVRNGHLKHESERRSRAKNRPSVNQEKGSWKERQITDTDYSAGEESNRGVTDYLSALQNFMSKIRLNVAFRLLKIPVSKDSRARLASSWWTVRH